MIVKVQISQFDSEGGKRMLIYNQDRDIMYETDATEDVVKAMGNEPKKYFHAKLIPDPQYPNSTTKRRIQLGNEASWQNW
jgi:hypothetical protein